MNRKQILQNRINSAEPYRTWKCEDHNMMGTGGFLAFKCCIDELDEMRGYCDKCGADLPPKNNE